MLQPSNQALNPGNARESLANHRKGERGFTLLELMIVITIIAILAAIGAMRYESAVTRAKEATLHSDLRTMRNAIDQYTSDKQQGPNSLDDLVQAGYIRDIPVDPMTGVKDWQTSSDPVLDDPDQTAVGITDVHAGTDKVSPFEGTPYSSW